MCSDLSRIACRPDPDQYKGWNFPDLQTRQELTSDLFRKDGPLKDSAWVLDLSKALYGLKQSPRMWYQKLVGRIAGAVQLRGCGALC